MDLSGLNDPRGRVVFSWGDFCCPEEAVSEEWKELLIHPAPRGASSERPLSRLPAILCPLPCVPRAWVTFKSCPIQFQDSASFLVHF